MSSGVWIADSGTTSHVVREHDLFKNYWEMPGAKLKGAGEIDALGRGNMTIDLDISGKRIPITLKDCIHAPKILHNLISLVRVTDTNFQVILKGSKLKLVDPNGKDARYCKGNPH